MPRPWELYSCWSVFGARTDTLRGAVLTKEARTSSGALGEYLTHLRLERGLQEKSITAYCGDLEQLKAYLGHRGKDLTQARTSDLQDFLADHDWSASTRARKTTSLR